MHADEKFPCELNRGMSARNRLITSCLPLNFSTELQLTISLTRLHTNVREQEIGRGGNEELFTCVKHWFRCDYRVLGERYTERYLAGGNYSPTENRGRLIDRATNFNLGPPRRISCGEKRVETCTDMQIALIYTVSGDCCLARLATASQIGERLGPLADVPEHRLPRFASMLPVPWSPMICDCACLATTLATTCVPPHRTCSMNSDASEKLWGIILSLRLENKTPRILHPDSNYIPRYFIPGCWTLITETEKAQEFNNLIYIPRGCV
ncbi:hypothetical protein WN51_00855 [Melipona quadrifasciata]|uniref:Uncharacterized protein n=1 Tax=Melipona quadrifasciata TaxID=166423 RepID=A0A0M9AB57_9HYME|nr:hypothetical protein WN51_00855 [Melipona quadrifasciata]